MKLIAVIPARLESQRFPGKVLKMFFNLPMIEHVRRRAIISNIFKEIIVVSGNKKILNYILTNKGSTFLSKARHKNGTSRASELSKKLQYDYAFILFGDEPGILPLQLKQCLVKMSKNKIAEVFNVVTNLDKGDLNSYNIVKCEILNNGKIIKYFRNNQIKSKKKTKILKSSGILIFKKKLLDRYKNLKIFKNEIYNKIEQMRFLNNDINVYSLYIKNIFPSINDKKEMKILENKIKLSKLQMSLIKKTKKII